MKNYGRMGWNEGQFGFFSNRQSCTEHQLEQNLYENTTTWRLMYNK